jgi:creatinine amidohydrolase
MGFPGTFTISPSLLVELVKEHLRCLAEAGLRRVVVTSSHGGNFQPLADALPDLRRRATALGLELVPVLDLAAFVGALIQPTVEAGLDQRLPAVQADLVETSLVLALRPQTARMDRAQPGYLQDFDVPTMFKEGLKAVAPNGVLGDPRAATPELGHAILASLERYLAEAIERGGLP